MERSGVRQTYAGALGGEPSGAGTMIPGTETRAEVGFRIVFVVTLYVRTKGGWDELIRWRVPIALTATRLPLRDYRNRPGVR